MMHSRQRLLLLAMALSLAACAPMNNRDGQGGRPPGAALDDRGGSAASPIAMLQEDLQKAAIALKLTPTQAVLWENYQDKVGALMADQLKLQPFHSSRQSALQQIARKVEVVRNRLTAMEDIQETAGKLYAALDPEQKKIADQSLAQTVPALYSGLSISSPGAAGARGGERPGSRGGPGGGMGGPSGGGGFGRN